MSHSEFLKGATVQTYGRTIFLETAQFITVLPFLVNSCSFLECFALFCIRKTFWQKFWLWKKLIFRKSGHMSHVMCHMSTFFSSCVEASWWRVFYQLGLPRLVFLIWWWCILLQCIHIKNLVSINYIASLLQRLKFWGQAWRGEFADWTLESLDPPRNRFVVVDKSGEQEFCTAGRKSGLG